MSSPDDSYERSNQPTSSSSRQRHRPDPTVRDRDFWVRPSAIRLPYLDIDVPLLLGSTGLHMVPVAPICRALHIDATTAIRGSQNKLLWSHAEILSLRFPQGGQKLPLPAFAWCLDYPLSIGYWLGNVSSMVKDQEQSQQLDQFIEAAMQVSGLAFDLVHEQYEAGRRGMYTLATSTSRLHNLYEQLRKQHEDQERSVALPEQSDASGVDPYLPVAKWLTRTRTYLDQAQTFIHQWSEHQQNAIVTDVVHINDHGQVIGDATSFAPFAVFTDEQQRQLQHAQVDCAHLLHEGEALLRGGNSPNEGT